MMREQTFFDAIATECTLSTCNFKNTLTIKCTTSIGISNRSMLCFLKKYLCQKLICAGIYFCLNPSSLQSKMFGLKKINKQILKTLKHQVYLSRNFMDLNFDFKLYKLKDFREIYRRFLVSKHLHCKTEATKWLEQCESGARF